METILVAVGSTRKPKVGAVSEALAAIRAAHADFPPFEIAAVEVPSGVRHTPLTREDLMAGARQRAEALVQLARANKERWKYFVGLEGGLDVVPGLDAMPSLDAVPELDVVGEARRRWVFLESWAYVTDGQGRGAFGQSGAVLLPETLAGTVVDQGVELAEAIDAFAGGHNIRDAEGAWGILTRNMISRQESFRLAVTNAFAPFFNQELYATGEKKAGA
ncbi:MAG: inosine/xanthosine triphosphatase [Candidatus Acidiferrales bacterium]